MKTKILAALNKYDKWIRWLYGLGFLLPVGGVMFISTLTLVGISITSFWTLSEVFKWLFYLVIPIVFVTLAPIVLGCRINYGKRVSVWWLHISNAISITVIVWLGRPALFASGAIDTKGRIVEIALITYLFSFPALAYLINAMNKKRTQK